MLGSKAATRIFFLRVADATAANESIFKYIAIYFHFSYSIILSKALLALFLE